MNVLFVCGRNRLRSPTAEAVVGGWPGVSADSAGVRDDADVVVTSEQVAWADVIVLMENRYRKPLVNRCGSAVLRGKRVVSLDIRDEFAFMAPALVELLVARVPRVLGITAPEADQA